MKRDVGIACKKVYGQGRIKVIVNIHTLKLFKIHIFNVQCKLTRHDRSLTFYMYM